VPECKTAVLNVIDAEYTAQYTSYVDVVDEDVRYVFGSYEEFVNQVPRDDVRRTRLVRWEIGKRKFILRQLPLAGAVYAGGNVDGSHY